MNRIEAKSALKNGHKITHKSFDKDEFIYELDGITYDESNQSMHLDAPGGPFDFWSERCGSYFDEGWEILIESVEKIDFPLFIKSGDIAFRLIKVNKTYATYYVDAGEYAIQVVPLNESLFLGHIKEVTKNITLSKCEYEVWKAMNKPYGDHIEIL